MIYSCFASTSRGLEEMLANEISSFGIANVTVAKSGVKFKANLTEVMDVNLQSRIASRVMIELATGEYYKETDIYDLAYKVDWDRWFSYNETIKVDTSAIASPLKSLSFVNLKVKDAICDKFVAIENSRPDVDKNIPDMRIYNFLTENTATIYLDTTGESLFKRGYRAHKLEAPLKENLAAGLIKLSNWTCDKTFFDPMCGSGTIAIEAISMALNLAPGVNRHFAFEKFKNHDKLTWNELKIKAKDSVKYDQKIDIYASDIDNDAIKVLEDNCRKLGVLKYINYKRLNFLETTAPNQSGIMVTNPPYGVRLNEMESMAEMYPLYARHLKSNFANWNCHFFTADLRMPKLMRLKPSRKVPLYNGALECRLFEFKMVSGSNRY